MKKKFIVNPLLCAISGATSAVFLTFTFVMLQIGRHGSLLFFAAFAALFLGVALHFGAVITIGPDGISRSVLGKECNTLSWDRIREVGVAGTRVIRGNESGNVGILYIYFSEKRFTEDERFRYILSWPHWNHCYMLFSRERIREVQMLWDKKVEMFNTGDLSLGEDLKN